MRCNIGRRKINRYRQATGLNIVHAQVRGGTDHRIDLFLADGTIWYWWKGEIPYLSKDHWNTLKGGTLLPHKDNDE